MTHGCEGGDTISLKSESEKKNQVAKIGNIPWNKGISMKKLGYTFNNRKSRSNFTEQQKIDHSIKIKNSEKYRKGLSTRTHGKSKKVIRIIDGETWNTIIECAESIGIKRQTLRRYIYQSKPVKNTIYEFLK